VLAVIREGVSYASSLSTLEFGCERVKVTCCSYRCRCGFRLDAAFGYYCRLMWTGWWHVSVVRTSVFGWRTSSDLFIIYGWQMTILWVNYSLWVSQVGQLGLPSLRTRYMWVVTASFPEQTVRPFEDRSFSTSDSKIWNRLPSAVFKQHLKSYLFNAIWDRGA